MKKLFTTSVFILALCSMSSRAQNLVPNPGFEIQDSCPQVSEIELAPPWDSPTSGTPDLMNSTCPSQNFPGRTGIGHSGIFCYIAASSDNREYLQAPLTSALIAGRTYCVSFYVKRSNYKYAVDRMGAYFLTGQIHLSMNTDYLPYTPQVENTPGNALSATGWIQISGNFVAAGGEDNIIIGNFAPDAQTTATVVNAGSTSDVSYYGIDDISVTECNVGIDENELASLISVAHEPASNTITISKPDRYSIDKMELYNSVGQKMSFVVSEKQSDKYVIAISDYDSGMYILQIEVDGKIVSKKILN